MRINYRISLVFTRYLARSHLDNLTKPFKKIINIFNEPTSLAVNIRQMYRKCVGICVKNGMRRVPLT